MHHDAKPKPKFKSPRKRASKLYNELQTEAVQKSKESKPEVWNVPFKVGDAVELEVLDSGGVDNPRNKKLDKIRGVVLGRENKGLDTAIYLKDVLFGEHVERKVKLHSPMVKSLKVLEANFVNKGKRKGKRVRRAKLYYLRERNAEGESVVLWHDSPFLLILVPCRCFVSVLIVRLSHYNSSIRTHVSCLSYCLIPRLLIGHILTFLSSFVPPFIASAETRVTKIQK